MDEFSYFAQECVYRGERVFWLFKDCNDGSRYCFGKVSTMGERASEVLAAMRSVYMSQLEKGGEE